MTDAPAASAPVAPPQATATSAGALLREARQARGLHVAALAASIKVTQRKLEALEGDRYDELPDMTFTRALAKTVCRSLKIDPAPVLALLPEVGDRGLDRVHLGLNTSFRDRPARREPTDLAALKRPMLWLPLLVLLAAAGLVLAPPGWIPTLGGAHAPASAPAAARPAPPASDPAASAAAVTPAVTASAAAPEATGAAAAAAAMTPSAAPASAPTDLGGVLELRVSGESWVEILDASGAALLQRTLLPGEMVGLDGTPPFRVKIGNVAVTQLKYRGQPVDLAASTRDNVARLDLK